MKFKIYGEKEAEKVVTLKLIPDEAEGVDICAVDEKGDVLRKGYIATFKPDGTLTLHSCINPDIGLALDDKGRIKIN